jgi:ABC-type dipeptide/oligopeptide/nickel transport system permease subunit
MIGRNVGSVDPYWWTVGVPVATLLLTILSLNVVAHGLEGLLDPYSER